MLGGTIESEMRDDGFGYGIEWKGRLLVWCFEVVLDFGIGGDLFFFQLMPKTKRIYVERGMYIS